MNEDIRVLIQAMALDRAYQVAGAVCFGCGLPAVRDFEQGTMTMCGACVPPPDESEVVVNTLAELKTVLVPTVRSNGEVLPKLGVRARVRSVEQDFVLELSREPCDNIATIAASCPGESYAGYRWVRELAPPPPHDRPTRRAVERLMSIWEGKVQ